MELYIILAIMSAFFFSISDVSQKYCLDNGVSNLQYIFWSHGIIYFICITALVILTLFYPIEELTNKKYNTTNTGILQLPESTTTRISVLLSGLFAFVGLILLVFSFQKCENIGYATAMISCTSIFSIVLSWYFLNKQIDKKALLGVLFIISGVYLISSTNDSVLLDR